jgi:hypothetical protein
MPCFFCLLLFDKRRLRRRIAFLRWMRASSLLETNHLLRRTVLSTPLRDTFFRKRFIICFCDSLGRVSTRTAKTIHILSFRHSCIKGDDFFPSPFYDSWPKFVAICLAQIVAGYSAVPISPQVYLEKLTMQ